MLLLLILTMALLATDMHVPCGIPRLLLPLKSHPIILAVVPAPLICISMSETPLVNSKEHASSNICDALDCMISSVFNLKLVLFIVAIALPEILSPVTHNAHSPLLNINRPLDPVRLTPMCAAGVVNEGTPNIVQPLHSTKVLLIEIAVPLFMKKQVFKP
jgi:hypothetical protein